MEYRIENGAPRALVVTLAPRENIFAEPEMVLAKSDGVGVRRQVKGRFLRGLKRKLLAGGSLFLEEYSAPPGGGTLRLGRAEGGVIVPVHLHEQAILCRRNAFLGFQGEMDLDVVFAMAEGGRSFEGSAFVLQKISGSGTAFIYADAYLVERPEAMRRVLRDGLARLPLFGAPAKFEP